MNVVNGNHVMDKVVKWLEKQDLTEKTYVVACYMYSAVYCPPRLQIYSRRKCSLLHIYNTAKLANLYHSNFTQYYGS